MPVHGTFVVTSPAAEVEVMSWYYLWTSTLEIKGELKRRKSQLLEQNINQYYACLPFSFWAVSSLLSTHSLLKKFDLTFPQGYAWSGRYLNKLPLIIYFKRRYCISFSHCWSINTTSFCYGMTFPLTKKWQNPVCAFLRPNKEINTTWNTQKRNDIIKKKFTATSFLCIQFLINIAAWG